MFIYDMRSYSRSYSRVRGRQLGSYCTVSLLARGTRTFVPLLYRLAPLSKAALLYSIIEYGSYDIYKQYIHLELRIEAFW